MKHYIYMDFGGLEVTMLIHLLVAIYEALEQFLRFFQQIYKNIPLSQYFAKLYHRHLKRW
jgi:hypothetical protein